MDLYLAVAIGAWFGMMWPFIIKLLKGLAPDVAVAQLAQKGSSTERGRSKRGALIAWIVLTIVVAAVVTALNIVPLVTGDVGEKLKPLGGWKYFFLATEGFAFAAFITEGIRPAPK